MRTSACRPICIPSARTAAAHDASPAARARPIPTSLRTGAPSSAPCSQRIAARWRRFRSTTPEGRRSRRLSSRRSRRTSRRRGGRRTAARLPPNAEWLGGPSEIVVVDSATGQARAVAASPDGRNVSPFWLSDGKTILFASDRGGKPFAIYSVEVETGRTRRLNGAGNSAQSPTVSPDGRELVFVGYSVEGFDLFSMPMDAATWTDVAPAATAPSAARRPRPRRPRPRRPRPRRPRPRQWPAAVSRIRRRHRTVHGERLRRGTGRRSSSRTTGKSQPEPGHRGWTRSAAMRTAPASPGLRHGCGPTGRSGTRTIAGGRRSLPPSPTTPIRGATARCGRVR